MRRGFTLIETIVYLALFTIVIGGLFIAAYAFLESMQRNQTVAMLREEEDFLLARIDQVLNGMDPVAHNIYGSSLEITHYDGRIFKMDVRDGVMRILREGRWHELSNTGVVISAAEFVHVARVGNTTPESVTAHFVISARTPTGALVQERASTVYYPPL